MDAAATEKGFLEARECEKEDLGKTQLCLLEFLEIDDRLATSAEAL